MDFDEEEPAHKFWKVDGVGRGIQCRGCREVFKPRNEFFRHLKVTGYHRKDAVPTIPQVSQGFKKDGCY